MLMVHSCLREICNELHSTKYYTTMADETTDASNKEQLVIIFCYGDHEVEVHEKLVDPYQLERTDAKTVVTVLKDVLTALNLDIHKLRRPVLCWYQYHMPG